MGHKKKLKLNYPKKILMENLGSKSAFLKKKCGKIKNSWSLGKDGQLG
jgi:hypothetical protein